jgi:hypothetical protein
MDELLAYLKRKGIPGVGQAEAVRRYKAASGDRTPPTYGVFDNLGKLDIVQHPLPSAQVTFEVTKNRLRTAFMGAPFNGYYTTDWDKPAHKRLYFHPTGKRFYEHGRLFVYYDANGLLLFDEGRATPLRISNYLERSRPTARATPHCRSFLIFTTPIGLSPKRRSRERRKVATCK